jgi:hypothetical protein
MAIGAGKIEGKNDVQQPGRVLGKLKEELREVPVRKQELASTTRVAIAAALGQKLSDVEDARAGQHGVGRVAAQQRDDAWSIGRQEVAWEMLRR